MIDAYLCFREEVVAIELLGTGNDRRPKILPFIIIKGNQANFQEESHQRRIIPPPRLAGGNISG
jgi:hypothetical protein